MAFVGELAWSETFTVVKEYFHNKIENYLKSMVNVQPNNQSQKVDENTSENLNILETLDEILIVKPSDESQSDEIVAAENVAQDLNLICSELDELDSIQEIVSCSEEGCENSVETSLKPFHDNGDGSDSIDGMIENLDFKAIVKQQNPPKTISTKEI